MSSAVHHLLAYGLGFVSSTFFLIAFFIASLRVLSLLSNSLMDWISVGAGMLARFSFSVFTSSVQLASLKFHLGSHCVFSACMSISVTIGKWSVLGGRASSAVLHIMMLFKMPSVQDTLSTRV